MTLQLAPLQPQHLEDAAALVSQRYRALCAEAPALPENFAKPDVILTKLAELTTVAPGVVALRGGKLVGFLAAYLLPSFRGRRGVYCPEWANGARLDDASAIHQELYRAIAGDWVRNGYFLHGLTIFANDRQGLDAWHWQGFGTIVADAIRDLAPVRGAGRVKVEISRAGAADLPDLRPLQLGLRRHLASAPIFLPLPEKWDDARYQAWLTQEGATHWLARSDGQPAAWMRTQIGDDGAGELVRDAATVAITGAYTLPAQRSSGVATALLQAVLDQAVANGAARLSVDFETQNIDGARFWLRHFQPVSYSVLRQVDERILWAHADREESAYW
jgi:GNAT superfamily N-acetyltransferase